MSNPKPTAGKVRRRLTRIADHFYSTPWAMQPEKLSEIADFLALQEQGVQFSAGDFAARIGGVDDSQSGMQIIDGVAVIAVHGVIEQRMNMFMSISGGTSTELLARDIRKAIADQDVKAILLDVDSPGGSVLGPAGVSDVLMAARGRKPIIAVANELMASAAMWIGSAADEIVAPATAMVGSIGVLSVHREGSVAEDIAGIKTTVLRSGKHKAVGNPHEPLSDDAKAVLQERVDSYFSLFVKAIAENRGMAEAMVPADGKIYVGQEAIDVGLLDRIGSYESVLEELRSSGRRATAGARKITAKESKMTDTLRTFLVRTGMPEDYSDEQADAYAVAKIDGKEPKAKTVIEPSPEGVRESLRAEEQQRQIGIRDMCKTYFSSDLDQAHTVADELIASGKDDAEMKAHILDILVKSNPSIGRIDALDSERDKFFEAASDGLSMRLHRGWSGHFRDDGNGRYALSANHLDRKLDRDGLPISGGMAIIFDEAPRKLHSGAGRFRNMRLFDIAKEHLRISGVETQGMPPMEIAKMALGWHRYGVPSASSYHVTKDFPNLLLDASNKSLLMGFNESPATYRIWCRQGASVPDFKSIHRVRLSEARDLEVIPENRPFPQDKLSDFRENYAVQTRGRAYSFSREALINDDLDSLGVMNIRAGRAAERTINRTVYAILTSNPAMSDDNSLFDTTNHSNDRTSGAAPGVSELNQMQLLFRTQNGLLSTEILLNTEMAFVIVPAALEGTAKELFRSTANPAAGGTGSGSSGVANIWQNFGGLVIEGQLDNNSAAIYYGAARWQDIDTIEYTFLDGEESPVIEDEFDFDTKGLKMTVHQTFGAKAIDWRGLVRNAGA